MIPTIRPTGTVTFLFTDIKGSTRLWEESPAAMRTALARHDAIIRTSIESNNGYVFSTGGDAFSAAFQSVFDALNTAIVAQAELQAEEWPEVAIEVRMAVHVGEAEERDGDYFGRTLNRAARVLSIADGREIVLSEAAAALARAALPPGSELIDRGRVSLKDLRGAERVFRLTASGLEHQSPSPGRQVSAGERPATFDKRPLTSGPGRTPLERDHELESLSALLAGVATSGGKAVLIRGEAGIGKSTLVREFIARQVDAAHVLTGSCDDLLTPQPLGPFWDIARTEPTLSGPLGVGDRPAFWGAVLDLLSRTLRPSILVVEDTQWADDATLDVIKYLGRRIAGTNALMMLTYRDGAVDHDHPLRRVIGELPPHNLARVHLDRLHIETVAKMIEGSNLDAATVMELTGGNPLFVTEVLASGVGSVPLSVQDSVLSRATQLSSGARQLLDLVSVIPGGSTRTVVEEILAPPAEHLNECQRQGLLRVDNGAVSFPHELTRRSIESALDSSDRRRLNGEVLAALIGRADPSRLVHHASQAEDVESIIEFAPLAAREAMAIGSHREAVAHFRTLEPFLDRIGEVDRAAIVDDWARNEFYLDNVDSHEVLARAIALHRANGDEVALARALTFAVRLNEVSGRPQIAEACSDEALEILESRPPSQDLAQAVGQRAWLHMMRGEGRLALDLSTRAIALAEATGDELTMIHALNTQGSEAAGTGDPAGFEILDQARVRAERGGHRFEEARALINMASVAADLRQIERAGQLAKQARDVAARYEIRALETYAQAHLAEVFLWKGAWDASEDTAREVLGSHPHVESLVGRVLGTLQARRGNPEAKHTLERSWSLAVASGEIQHMGPTGAAVAEYMWLAGEPDPDRLASLHELVGHAVRGNYPWVAGDLALWLWKLGELSEAPDGISEPQRLVIDGEGRAAAEIWEGIGCPYDKAVALLHVDGPARLEALEIFETLGAAATASKLKEALREDGIAIPRGRSRKTREHAANLTARQAEILQLLAEDLTNSQIADRLFVSPRTVEHHVSAVLGKLGETTRADAVSRARRDGLLGLKDG